jgi:osmoprotectant transport system ATP-binding protein
MIELKKAARRFGGTVALLPCDLSLTDGQTTVLIGESGSGKSTILRLIVGLLEPTSGEVFFGGAPVSGENLSRIRHRTGYVIQDGGLFPHLTARDNVLLLGRHLGKPESRLCARLEELCELTRFPASGLARYPVELSGGQRQRVALMRALMLDPDVLLLDEPLAALDPMVRSRLQSDLREIFRSVSKTVVFVTHDLAEAAYLADRIVLMREGRIVQDGTLADLRDRPAEQFVTEFLESQRALSL